jgi:hypothetical protein
MDIKTMSFLSRQDRRTVALRCSAVIFCRQQRPFIPQEKTMSKLISQEQIINIHKANLETSLNLANLFLNSLEKFSLLSQGGQ